MGRIVRLLISAVLVAIVVSFADWRAIWDVLRKVSPAWVGGALALAILDRVLINYRFQVLLKARGIFVGFWRLFRMQLAANFLGSFLPSFIGVDAVRIAALMRAGEPANKVIAATLVDRVTLMVATLMFGSVMLFLLSQTRVPQNISNTVIVLTAIAMAGAAISLHPAVRRWVRLNLLPRLPEKIRVRVNEVADAVLAYRHEGRAAAWVGVVTGVLLFVRILFAKAVVLSTGADVSLMDLMLIIPILWVIVMLPITIGNIGVQDAGYVVVMALVGVSAPVAVSMSVVEHIVARAASLPGALFLGDVTARKSPTGAGGGASG
jgi:glycosyltransferase 2 family protein